MSTMKRSEWEVFFDALATGDTGGAIMNQEALGQQDLIHNDVIPREMGHGTSREAFEALGFVFGDPVDDLFVACTLPTGWKKVAEDHAMWSKIVDDQGRERAAIFYKAAFYDRNARISLSRRFSYGDHPIGGWGQQGGYHDKQFEAYVSDCGEPIWRSESYPYGEYQTGDERKEQALAWLNEHYPDWQNPLAYWDPTPPADETAG